MTSKFDVVIVGAGHGGAQAAQALRQQNFAGSILMIGDEPDLPYQRPPLSKEYLSGEFAFDRLLLRTPAFWTDNDITLRLGTRVTAVEADAHRLLLNDKREIGYRHLIWATGGEPRRLPCEGATLSGVHHLRRRSDVDQLAAEMPGIEEVVVVGGGYIGLEAASVLTKLCKRVTVVEALDRVLARVAGPVLSSFFEQEHRAHGVTVLLDTQVERIIEQNGRAAGVMLAGGRALRADAVIVGIGIIPSVAPLLQAGAAGTNGVDVDDHCRTSLADVFAIGDCAAHINSYAHGARIRLESVQNAHDQAMAVSKTLAGIPTEYRALPWFWSMQYDLRLQTLGLSLGHDDVVTRGDPASRCFSVLYLKEKRIIALDCVNLTRDYVQGRSLLVSGSVYPRDLLADPSTPLKSLLAQVPA